MMNSPYNQNAPSLFIIDMGGGVGLFFIYFVQDCSLQLKLMRGIFSNANDNNLFLNDIIQQTTKW